MFNKKEISMYSNLSSDNLDNLHEQFTAKYGMALHDTSLSIEERSLKNLIAKKYNEPEKQEEEYHAVCEFVRKDMIRQTKEFALLTFLAMKKRNNYGMMGGERVSVSFYRNMLDISNNREVYQFDANQLNHIIDDCDKRNGGKSGDEYLYYLRQYTFELLGKKYCHDELRDINNIFYLMDADYFLFRYFDNDYGSEFIFGEISKIRVGNDKAFVIKKEYIRTPQFTLSCAGKIYNNTMLIRKEACEVIFLNKWQKFYGQSKVERKRALRHLNSSIREGLKAKALEYYDAKNVSDVMQIKEIFISDMINGIFWHEIGHHLADEMNPIHVAFRTNFSEDIGGALVEALADWSPVRGKRKGSFAYFVELSKTDIRNAAGNIYVNMSDNWFVDEEAEFLCSQSNVLVGLAYLFINSDGSVDFDRIERDNKKIYDFLQEQFKILSDKALDIVYNAAYDLGNRIIDYKTLENELYEFYQYGKNASSLEELLKYSSFWKKVFVYLKKYSKEGWDKFQKLLSEENNSVENLILKMADGDNEKKYKSLRDYIIERSKEIGVIKMPPEINYKAAVQKACNEINMPETVQKKVQARFKKIIEGKSIDVSLNYDGEADPFITILQEMMIKSGYGGIESGILMGEFYNPDAASEELKEYISDELENLLDEIESKMYHEIKKLRVNKKYSIHSIIKKLLTTISFTDGAKLASKIKSVEYMEFDNDALMEVFIPLKRGYMDRYTEQAVWKINQDLRPDEFMTQCVIDRDFLEALLEAYSK